MQEEPKVVKTDYPFRRGGLYHITFDGKELSLPSVTSILGDTLPKKFLVHWAAKQAAIAALENPGMSVEEAVAAIYKKRDAASGLGRTIHSWAESYIKGEKPDLENLVEGLQPYAQSFTSFMDKENPKPLIVNGFPFSEITVFNAEVGYAGTLDFASDKHIYDWKTGKGIYIDHHLQQIAYLNATHALLPDRTIVKMPKLEGAYLVHLRNTGRYSMVEAEGTFDEFKLVVNMYNLLRKYE